MYERENQTLTLPLNRSNRWLRHQANESPLFKTERQMEGVLMIYNDKPNYSIHFINQTHL